METRLLNVWDRVLGSFWFLPLLVILCATFAGIFLPILETKTAISRTQPDWLTTTPEGARSVLSVIAGGMITVAGVVFSVTMVTLSIASSQFGSRVLRDRMRDRATQVALGAFLGTSVYCFLVLRTIQATDAESFVPHLSVVAAIAIAFGSLVVLIYFIHDVAEAIQAPHVVARLAADLDAAIERLFPERLEEGELDEEPDREAISHAWEGESQSLTAFYEGYLQAIDGDSILAFADRHKLVLELWIRPGDFIVAGDTVAEVWGLKGDSADAAACVNHALILGNTRTPRQDLNCAIHELAQLSVRALSPGINDPFTAINGIDRLAAALGRLAQRKLPLRFHRDPEGQVRVFADCTTFAEALAAAFNQIRRNAAGSPAVGMRLLERLESIARKVRREADGQAVLGQAEMTLQGLETASHQDGDLRGLREKLNEIKAVLGEKAENRSNGAADSGSRTRRSGNSTEPTQPPAEGEVNG